MPTIKERAQANELDCLAGTMQILYTLAENGILAEPYRSWISGLTTEPGENYDKYQSAIREVSELLIVFNDEIDEHGCIGG